MGIISFGEGGGSGGGGGGLIPLPAVNASGTAFDLTTALPDGSVEVVVLIDQVNTNTGNRLVLNLGTASGYTGQPGAARMVLESSNVSNARTKVVVLTRVSPSNKWIATGDYEGEVTLTAPLSRLQLTLNTISGNTNTFSGGRAAVLYSGLEVVGALANATTDSLPQGTTHLYWSQGLFDTAFGNKTTDNLPEGSSKLFFTDARAQAAITASGIVSKSGGAISTDTAGLATAMKGILAEGSNVEISQSGNSITVSTTGGGGSLTTISGITISNMEAGQVLVATGSNTMGNGKVGAAGIADGAATTAKLDGLTGTSSGYIYADGDGTMSTRSGTGSGGSGTVSLANFNAISDSTILDKGNDGVLMYDGDSLARMDVDRFEEEIEPLELKTITLSNYTYQNRNLPSGVGGWTVSPIGSVLYAIFNGRNQDQTRQLSKIMTPNFKVRVVGSNASRWYEFVVTAAAATQGGSILGVIHPDYIDSSAANQAVPFSNDESCTVTSQGRHLSYGDLEHTVNTTRRTQAVSAYGLGNYVTGLQASDRQFQQGADNVFATPKQIADNEREILQPQEWSGYSFQDSEPDGNTASRFGEDDNVDYLFQFVSSSQAVAEAQDARFTPGELIEIKHDDDNLISGRVEYADARAAPSGSNWIFEVKINETGITEEGSFDDGDSITLKHTSKLGTDILNNMTAGQAVSEQGTDEDLLATASSIGWYVRHSSGEQAWTGFQVSTAASPVQMALGTWQTASANSPFVRTLRYRPHTKTESDAILREAVPGSFVQQYQTANIFNQYRVAVITAIPVPNSDVPVIQMLAVFQFTKGTFAANTDSTLTVVGAIRSLSVRSSDSKLISPGGTNIPMSTSTWTNVPHRNSATETASDNRMEVYVPSRTSVINTTALVVSGWVASSGTKKADMRVQWSTDGGTNWTSGTTLPNLYHTDVQANLPISASYQIRPGATGRVLVRWQVKRGTDSTNWWPDTQQTACTVS